MHRTLLLLVLVSSSLAACASVRSRNLCEEDGMEHVGVPEPRDCHVCASDEDCIFQGNVCEGVVYCAHRDVGLVSNDIGCDPEPDPPSDEGCVCRDDDCQLR